VTRLLFYLGLLVLITPLRAWAWARERLTNRRDR